MSSTGPVSLAVLSNRGPLSFKRDAGGQLVARRAPGGLVTTVGPGVEKHDAVWVAAAISDADRAAATAGVVEAEGFRLRSLVIELDRYRMYYDVITNQTLWFLHHGLWDHPRRPRFDRKWWQAWDAYVAVNHLFASAAAEQAAEGSTVLIQDVHLTLVGGQLAKLRPDLRTAVFLHTPFCTPSELDVLPPDVSNALLLGLGAAGSCGFHTARWAAAFEACCQDRLGRIPPTFVSPAAPDVEDLASVARSARCQDELQKLEEQVGDRQLIVRVDRIELSKNLLRGFYAFDDLLENQPSLRGRVVFGAFVYPSRETLAEYLGYRQEVESLVRRVNARWGTADWTPVLLDTVDNYPRSIAALRRYDVLLVNPMRDGLNLVAKEGPLVNERDGVLALSRGAGAWDELGPQSTEVHPYDIRATSDALLGALQLPPEERGRRAGALRNAAGARTPLDWFSELLSAARLPGELLRGS
jgi:trehalose 6-phosphate synthase